MRKTSSILPILLLLLGVLTQTYNCTGRQTTTTPPWQGVEDSATQEAFDLGQIEHAGELIAVTLSGPDTYYDYQGRHLGAHFLLCQRFASHLGVRLRMETCRDTAEVFRRLAAGDADLAALPISGDTVQAGWLVGDGKPQLAEALAAWYRPELLAEVKREERSLLQTRHVRRRVHAPMLSNGVISHYDELFKRYARTCNWDWRLIAAQCYQESTFDPDAESWAGAKGLMQIMPRTADHLGLPRDQITDPEQNIAAATRYLRELEHDLIAIHNRTERQNFVLASYNGGILHVRDAMRLAERDHKDPHRWADVRPYILKLSQPEYYRDTLVQYGYMRGSETADYVDRIRERYDKYRRSVRP